MAEYTFSGGFHITTDCSDLEEVTKSLNETARIFGDIIKWRTNKSGYMFISSDVCIDLPVRDFELEYIEENEEAPVEEEPPPSPED